MFTKLYSTITSGINRTAALMLQNLGVYDYDWVVGSVFSGHHPFRTGYARQLCHPHGKQH